MHDFTNYDHRFVKLSQLANIPLNNSNFYNNSIEKLSEIVKLPAFSGRSRIVALHTFSGRGFSRI